MATHANCPWCNTLNPADVRHCLVCGHEAHASRLACNCHRCAPPRSAQAPPKAVRNETHGVFPRELALGNIVRLKAPYWGQDRRREGGAKPFTHGIVVEHLHNTGGVWIVSLHLYDNAGVLYLHSPSGVPIYVDTPASDFVLVKLAREVGYRVVSHDLYPEVNGERGYTFHPLPEGGA